MSEKRAKKIKKVFAEQRDMYIKQFIAETKRLPFWRRVRVAWFILSRSGGPKERKEIHLKAKGVK